LSDTTFLFPPAGNPHIVYWSLGKLKHACNPGLPSVGWITEVIDASADRGNDDLKFTQVLCESYLPILIYEN
jgi:hypothetical protein